MADTYKYGSIYKVKTGTNTWEHHFFKTRADLVDPAQYTASNTTYYKLPLDTQYHTVNGEHFGQTSGITLYASNITLASDDDTSISSKLSSMQTAINGLQSQDADLTAIAELSGTSGFLKKTAANTWSLDTTVLTSSNYSSTLGSVYEAKFTDGSATIASESNSVVTLKAGVSQSSGAIGNSSGSDITLAKVAKTGAFGDLSGTGNVVSTSSTLTSDKIVVGNGNKTLKDSTYSIMDIVNISNGKTKAYTTTAYKNGNNYYILAGTLPISDLPSSAKPGGKLIIDNEHVFGIPIDSSTTEFYVSKDGTSAASSILSFIYQISNEDGTIYAHALDNASHYFSTVLNVGDSLYITQTNLPDFWFTQSGGLSPAHCSVLETVKQDLSGYSTTSHTHTTSLASTTDSSTVSLAYGGKYKLTAGETSVVFTMPSSDNTNYYHTREYTSGLKISTGTGVDDLYVPAPSTSHGGIVPALVSASVSTQTTSTKFLREDGTWAVPSYTTDTDKKAASGDSDSKIFLIGATSQSTDGQTTYSHGEVYVGTDHCLYSNSVRVRNIYVASSAPSSAVIGDIWIDTTNA